MGMSSGEYDNKV